MIHFFKLLRWKNLLLLILTQILVKYALLEPLRQNYSISLALSTIDFIYLIIATVFIAAAGYIINDIYVLVVNGQDHFVANVTLNTSLGNMTFDVEFALWGYPTGSEVLLEFVTTPFVIVEPVEYYFPPTATVPDATVRNEIELFYQFLNDPAFNEADFCYLFVILNNDYSFMDPPDCEGERCSSNAGDGVEENAGGKHGFGIRSR